MDWFDLIFESFNAFGQIMILVVGLVFFIIGGALVYDHITFGKKALKVRGMVSGLRVSESGQGKQPMYYPVVEYVGADGTTVQANSDSGSSAYIKYVPGMPIEVFVKPDRPEVFRLRGTMGRNVGIVFILLGMGGAGAAFTLFNLTVMTPIVGAAFLLWGFLKIKKHIKPREQWETVSTFRARKQEEFNSSREALPIMDRTQVLMHIREKDKTFRRWLPLSFLISLSLMGAGTYFGNDMAGRLQNDPRAQGQVTGFEDRCDSEGCTYAPVVQFSDDRGRTVTFTDKVSSSSPREKTGDTVTVIYKGNDPDDAIIDRGYWNWLLSGGLFGAGLLLCWGLLAQYAAILRRERRV